MTTDSTDERIYEEARRRVRAKREFWSHLIVYAVINIICFIIWVLGDRGYPWFLWVLGPWGLFIILPHYLRAMVFVSEKEERAGNLSPSTRTGRTSASIWAIAWSIALFVFFNFFSDYIALHHGGGIREPLITAEFSQWLWIINTTLILSVIGHTIAVIFDRYLLRESILVVINIFAIAAVAVLLSLFPFDFSIIPNADVAYWVDLGVQIGLIVTLVGLSIGTLVGLIKLIVNLAKGTKIY